MKSLIIRKLMRTGPLLPDEELIFREGVNVLVGRPNTGKTKWFQMLDYAFGSDKPPQDVFGDDLAKKYDTFKVTVEIEGTEFTFERRWMEAGNRGKVFVDGTAMLPQDFNAMLLQRLDIPLLHYPQGSPYGVRTWPELNWRGLLRHIYRQQRFWGDLADAQPTSEQHACILQFLGVAEHIFSADYGKLVEQQKQIWDLQSRREQFLVMLHEVSRDILDEEDRGLTLTPESITAALARVRTEIGAIEEDRKAVLANLTERAMGGENGNEIQSSLFDQESERLAQLIAKSESLRKARAALESRILEVESYSTSVLQEIGRLERAQAAGETLANLKVTHCPACDQPVSLTTNGGDKCYVCGQRKPEETIDGTRRIAFEMEHLKAEQQEFEELLITLRADVTSHALLEKSLASEKRKIEVSLRPAREAAAAILPPELALLDVRAGQLQERLAQLERIRSTFAKRDQLSLQIQQIEKSVAELEVKVEQQSGKSNMLSAGDWLADGMNDYCNVLNSRQPRAWPQGRIHLRLGERRFDISVGGGRWQAKLGGTLTLYFFIAYHYGLLRLFERTECHYPGLVILDFPPVLEDGSSVHDKENFVVEPFIELLNRPEYTHTQVIAAGSAFENLVGANRIELEHVWTEGGESEESSAVGEA